MTLYAINFVKDCGCTAKLESFGPYEMVRKDWARYKKLWEDKDEAFRNIVFMSLHRSEEPINGHCSNPTTLDFVCRELMDA